MALNLGGDDISIGGGGGPSPSDPNQDAKIFTLENKTQNINSTTTDATKTTFDNKVVAGEMDTPLSTAVKFRSNQYFDGIGNSGFYMGVGANGSIQMNKTTYQGTADAIMTLSSNGTIQKTGSTCDASGNLTSIKFQSSQYYDSGGVGGIFMTAGSGGEIQMNKNPYKGTADAIMTLSTNGTIQKTGAICDASSNITTTGYIQAPIINATTSVTTDLISNKDATPIPAIEIAPTTSDLTLRSTTYQGTADAIMTLSTNGTVQKTGSTCDASGNLTAIKFRSSQYYDNGGNSGFFMTAGPTGQIQMNKTTYQGTNGAIMKLSTNGTIEKSNVIIDASNNLSTLGYIQAPIISATNTITTDKISNQDATPILGIELLPTTGIIKLHKDTIPSAGNINLGSLTDKFFNGYFGGTVSSLISDANLIRTLGISNQNNITAIGIDNTTADIKIHKNISPNTGSTTIDIGDTSNRFRDIYYSGNLNGPTAPPTEFAYDLTFTDLIGSGALRDEWFSTLTQSKIFINKLSNQTIADLFITYTRTMPNLTEIKLDGTTTGTTSTQKYVDFRDSGGLPNDYQPNELYNITFDAGNGNGNGNTWEMKVISCAFEHSGSGTMYDRLGIQQSADNITYTNVSLDDFYQSATTTPPWSTTRTSTTDGYIFPVDSTLIANKTFFINSRYIKFYFTSDNSSQRAGWDVRLTASDAFHGSLLIKDVNTYANTKYAIKGGAYAQNNGNDLELKYEMSPSSPLTLNFNGSIPLVNFTTPAVGWTQIAQNTSQVSLTGDITGSSLTVSNDINLNGDIYKNGVLFSGGGVNGITSVDNGGGDIEISFSGNDYKQQGYLTVDTNGKIQVTPSIVVSNAEFDNIVTKWNFERSNNNLTISKIYLPVGVPVGSFNHAIHNIYLALQDAVNNTKIIYDVKFVNYNGSTQISETTVSNITNAVEIYNSGSTAHPNNVANANLKAHISNHFTSDYGFANFPGFTVTTTPRVAVPSALVSSWSHTDPFAITFGVNGGAPFSSFYISTLYGSQSGFTNASTSSSAIPAGYTEVF